MVSRFFGGWFCWSAMNQNTSYAISEFARPSDSKNVRVTFVGILAETGRNRNTKEDDSAWPDEIKSLQDCLLDRAGKIGKMSEELTRALPEGRSFEERVFARFDFLDARSNSIDIRFDAVENRLAAVDKRFDSVENGLDSVERRFDSVAVRLDGLDVGMQALEAKALNTKPIWERALAELLEVRRGVEDLNRKIDVLSQDVLQVRADQRRLKNGWMTLSHGSNDKCFSTSLTLRLIQQNSSRDRHIQTFSRAFHRNPDRLGRGGNFFC